MLSNLSISQQLRQMDNFNKKSEKTVGPIIGSFIVVVLLIIASLYFWGQKLNSDQLKREKDAAASSTTKNDVQAIKMDLNATSVKEIDTRAKNGTL